MSQPPKIKKEIITCPTPGLTKMNTGSPEKVKKILVKNQ